MMPTPRRSGPRPSSTTAPFAPFATRATHATHATHATPIVLLVAVALALPSPARGAPPSLPATAATAATAATDAQRTADPATVRQADDIDPFDLAIVRDYKLTFDRADDVLVGLRWDGGFLGEPPASVALRYAVDGGRTVELPMPSRIEGGLQQWKATIPKQPAGADVTYYLRAEWPDGKVAFVPGANLTQPSAYTVAGAQLPPAADSDLVINELLADNGDGDVDEAGEHEDWVELHNKGTTPINLSGYFLTDDPTKPDAWPLPDITLAPGAFVAIWCDDDGSQGPLHANFKLSKAGEMVQLATSDAVVDSVTFGAQTTDVSWARWPDGTGAWGACARVTIGRANACGGGVEGTATATATATRTGIASATRPATASATSTGPAVTPPATPISTATATGVVVGRLYLPVGYRLR